MISGLTMTLALSPTFTAFGKCTLTTVLASVGKRWDSPSGPQRAQFVPDSVRTLSAFSD